MILVTAGSGHQGQMLIPKLAAAGFKVRTTTSSPAHRAGLEHLGASEVVVGDIRNPDVYDRAAQGVETIYHIGPAGLKGEAELGLTMIDAAKRHGVRHVVLSSVYYTEINIIQHLYKKDIEVALIESGLPFTVLKPCDFMVPGVYIAGTVAFGGLVNVSPQRLDKRHSLIAIDDLTDAAVRVITEGSRHYYARYELAGPDKIDLHEIRRILSRVMGRDLPIVEKTIEECCQMFWGDREMDEEMRHARDILASAERWYRDFEFVGNPNALEWLLGRRPTSFETFAQKAWKEYLEQTK